MKNKVIVFRKYPLNNARVVASHEWTYSEASSLRLVVWTSLSPSTMFKILLFFKRNLTSEGAWQWLTLAKITPWHYLLDIQSESKLFPLIPIDFLCTSPMAVALSALVLSKVFTIKIFQIHDIFDFFAYWALNTWSVNV